jgi:hypothetical protein
MINSINELQIQANGIMNTPSNKLKSGARHASPPLGILAIVYMLLFNAGLYFKEMIASLFNGGVFLVDKEFLPDGVPLEQMLLFNQRRYADGIKVEAVRGATVLSAFLEPVPESKPWIDEWNSEQEKIHHHAEAELGKDGLAALLTSAKAGTEPSKMSQETGDQMARTDEMISYW